MLLRFFVGLMLTFSLFSTYAKGVSPYLPLKLDPVIELEIERLASLAKMPVLAKPYHIATVNNYLVKVRDSHPQLYLRLSNYIKRYKKSNALTHMSAEVSSHSGPDVNMPNARGQSIDDSYRFSFTGFTQMNEHILVNAGGTYYEGGDFIPHGTYLSMGWDVLQLDIGYREHWLAPHHDSALLLTTQAKPPLMATLSNSAPLTDWNVKYEFAVGLLDEQDGIHYDGEDYSGKPGFLTMHFSFQPFDWWTIGGNRTMMFGGGAREVTWKDVWNAIIDPVNNDNCGGDGTDLQDCDQEVGNQIASLTHKLDFTPWDYPVSIFIEYGGEDTREYKAYKFGNIGQNYAIFLPYLTESTSLNLEWSKFHSAWYVHHIYGEGYSNDGTEMGHWWGDNKAQGDPSSGQAISAKLTWDNGDKFHVTTLYRTATYEPESAQSLIYQRSHELEVKLNYVVGNAFLGLNFYGGQDNFGDSFFRTSLSYIW